MISIILFSCGIFNSGYYDSNQQYRPKNPKFQLKDKSGFFVPSLLGIDHIYKLESKVYLGKEIYPVSSSDPNSKFDPLFNIDLYIKFLTAGRCYAFSKQKNDDNNVKVPLQKYHLNTDRHYTSKEYYYPISADKFQIENFVPAQGKGRYIIKNVRLLDDGRRLQVTYEQSASSSYDIYSLVSIPEEWAPQNVNW